MIGVSFDDASTTIFLTRNDRRATMRFVMRNVAMIFTMSHQWTRTGFASRRRYGYATFARTKLTLNGETRIRLTTKLFARALMTFATWFGDTTFSGTTRIGTADFGLASVTFQTWARASIGAFFPFIFAFVRWFRKRIFRASDRSTATIITFVETFEIIFIPTATGIIEFDASAARHVECPSTLMMMTSTVIDTSSTTTVIASFAMSVRRIEQHENR